MPPKKKDSKQEKGEQKALEKQKQKIVEDKTFGLKNKNKSKAVQKYIKGIQQQAHGSHKGGEQEVLRRQAAEKEEKKKTMQQEMLLQSLFRGTENIKKLAESAEKKKIYDPKTSKQEQKINLYVDQREQKLESGQTVDRKAVDVIEGGKTGIICKYFLQAVEKKQYGWLWVCPNGGDNCMYRHCLPEGYIIKESNETGEEGEDDELTLEERIENERLALPPMGTPVTLETFTEWKKRKEEERLKQIEDQRRAEAQRTGTKGLHILTGRDLFTFDPSLFVDAEGAAFGEDYEELETSLEETILENQRIVDEANKEGLEGKGEADESTEPTDANSSVVDVKPINYDLFLEDDIPDNLNLLDE